MATGSASDGKRPGCASTTGDGVRKEHNSNYHPSLNEEEEQGDISCGGRDDRMIEPCLDSA